MNFNLQFNSGCIKYKALKMTFGRGPLLSKNYYIFQKLPKKTIKVTLKVHDNGRGRFNMFI